MPRVRKVICNNIHYQSLNDFCKKANLSYYKTKYFLNNGGTPEEALVRCAISDDSEEHLIRYGGHVFRTFTEFCKFHQIDVKHAQYLRSKGASLNQILDACSKNIALEKGGVTYGKMKEFSDLHGIQYDKVRRWVRAGKPLSLLIEKEAEKKQKNAALDKSSGIADAQGEKKTEKTGRIAHGQAIQVARDQGVAPEKVWYHVRNGLSLEEAVKKCKTTRHATPIKVGDVEAPSLRAFCRKTGMTLLQLQRGLASGKIVNEWERKE